MLASCTHCGKPIQSHERSCSVCGHDGHSPVNECVCHICCTPSVVVRPRLAVSDPDVKAPPSTRTIADIIGHMAGCVESDGSDPFLPCPSALLRLADDGGPVPSSDDGSDLDLDADTPLEVRDIGSEA